MQTVQGESSNTYPIRMPGVNITQDEVYLCTGVEVGAENRYWVSGFSPLVTPGTVHHMGVTFCSERPVVAQSSLAWNCGEGDNPVMEPGLPFSNECKNSRNTYVWSQGGAPLMLPPDTGFPIGGDTAVQYIILQIHFVNNSHNEPSLDNSGVNIHFNNKRPSNSAGVISVLLSPTVPAGAEVVIEGGCQLAQDKTLRLVSFLAHTHSLAKEVTAWRVRREREEMKWDLIGSVPGNSPQSFRTVASPGMMLSTGDWIAVSCAMSSNRTWDTTMGPSSNQEMCNLYLVYMVKGDHTNVLMGRSTCWSPLGQTWSKMGLSV